MESDDGDLNPLTIIRVAANRELTCLKEIFYKAIHRNKFEGVNPSRKIKKLDETLNRVRFLSEGEEEKHLAACEDPLRSTILIGIYAGLRIQAEALRLKWANIDLERKHLTFEAAYAKIVKLRWSQ